MSQKKPSGKNLRKPADGVFTEEERAAMKELVRERKAGGVDGASAVRATIAAMAAPDQAIGVRIHEIITRNAPHLQPRLWYGMPAWARDGKVVCFFQAAQKFKTRYCSLGFMDAAALDSGLMWPTAFALTKLTETEEASIAALIRKAAG